MKDGATPHRTKEVFEAFYNVYGNRVSGLGYPKFSHEGIDWPPWSTVLNPCDYCLRGYIKDQLLQKSNNDRKIDESY